MASSSGNRPLVTTPARLNILRKLCSNTSLSQHEGSLLKAIFIIGIGGFIVGYNIGLVAGGFFKKGSLDFTIDVKTQNEIVAFLYIGKSNII